MVGWRHRLDGHEFEQAPGVGDGQGGLACRSPWGCRELDMTEGQKVYTWQGGIKRLKIPWMEETPGYSPWGLEELDTTEATSLSV